MLTRRACLTLAAGAGIHRFNAAPKYKAAIIGHTGQGNYGHNWDLTWNRIPSVEVVAVADPVEQGRERAMRRSGALRGYADYREMLAKEKPNLVVIAPRWADQHLAMVKAAAEVRAHILLEKPFAQSLPEADEIAAIADRNKIRIQAGHAARFCPTMQHVMKMLALGEIGQIVEMRARGKEDQRAGGEDMVVLGTHAFDLMRLVAGDPVSVTASVTQKNKGIVPADRRQCKELTGWVAGDAVDAAFTFANGVPGHFASKAATPNPPPDRCGLWIYCTKGAIFINLGTSRTAEGFLLRSASWMALPGKQQWEPLPWTGPEVEGTFDRANNGAAVDLLAAIEQNREPLCSARDGRWTIEMVAGVYRSQMTGRRVSFPLEDRRDPLQP
jgi:predicted dehydrogenase